MSRHLIWFRNDLRVGNNPAVHHALQGHNGVHAVYIDCPGQWRLHDRGKRQLQFVDANLDVLQTSLRSLDIELHRLRCDSFAEVPELLASFTTEHAIDVVYANREFGVDEQRRDDAVGREVGCEVRLFDADCVAPPGSLVNAKGKMYRVFTTFRNAWLKYVQAEGYQVYPDPRLMRKRAAADSNKPWPAGEDQAYQRLEAFCEHGLADYGELRDYPAQQGTSALSPYLAVGALSVGQCLSAIENRLGYLPFSPGEQGFQWLNELIWREFYRHLMAAYPDLSMNRPFKPETVHLDWTNDQDQFDAWCQGRTGFPIIDAAMRCLNKTGWMHNRLRMIVASFLVKDLHIDWRWGERYFMQQLIDGDFASNNGGWQWTAGTGADAAPYFRIFNPTRQGERFDEHGEFIRRWVPELVQVPGSDIHQPHAWLQQHDLNDYPPPVVDHRVEREACLKQFQALKDREVA